VMVSQRPSTTGARPMVIFRQLPNAGATAPVLLSQMGRSHRATGA
jgi:hypothetical protein